MAEITEALTKYAPLIKALQVEGGEVVGYLLSWNTHAGEQVRHYGTDLVELAETGVGLRESDLANLTADNPERDECLRNISIFSS